VQYDYMHIRMKQQSTKYVKAAATGNSIPKYVLVVLFSNNLLKVFDTDSKV